MIREWRLRMQCRTLLRRLDIHPPLDLPTLLDRIAADRGRPIELHAYPLPVPGPLGVWYGLPDRDLICYQQQTPEWHQHHIVLHELGHALSAHPSDLQVDDEVTRAIAAAPPEGVDPAELSAGGEGPSRRRRTCYSERYEREAELYASTIQEWASVLRREPVWAIAPGERAISESLTHHQGWR